MADDTTREALTWAVGGAGGLSVVGLLGVLIRGLLTGTIVQEKEVRDDLRTEVNRLREDQVRQQGEIDGLRTAMRLLTGVNLHLMTSRADARAALREAERELHRTPTEWPVDPIGGT
ncbi:hypothetical protein ACI3L1_06795 [Deinococcus sp. SM5_A1]|uniref:hypothetical protein n=1 Tax=Deinococcus sp. SM5_A1 TaxID=3379094 RepID=UPI00385EAE71